jgi:NADPH:quinone reductase-like Zn-dependent oxidoreductase
MSLASTSTSTRVASAVRPATRASRAPASGRVVASAAAAAPAASARLSMRTSVSNTSALRPVARAAASRAAVRVQAGLLDKLTGKSGGAKKTVIITGASSGLGLATAVSLIDQVRHTAPTVCPHHACVCPVPQGL